MTATNEVYVPGVFGDMFDVIFAYPDAAKWRTIDTYPVVIAAGEIDLTVAEGQRLAEYVEKGGTLLVAAEQFTGPGLAALKLPVAGPVMEANDYRWLIGSARSPDAPVGPASQASARDARYPSQRFRFQEIPPAPGSGFRALATTGDGQIFCAASDRGAGRLIYLTIPRGLGIDRGIHPVVPRLFAHLTRGLMPVEVEGDVEWLVNHSASGWLVTLMNPAGQDKPQHGITPTDYRENRHVTIRSRVPVSSARDRLLPNDTFTVEAGAVRVEVPAGSVRIMELK